MLVVPHFHTKTFHWSFPNFSASIKKTATATSPRTKNTHPIHILGWISSSSSFSPPIKYEVSFHCVVPSLYVVVEVMS